MLKYSRTTTRPTTVFSKRSKDFAEAEKIVEEWHRAAPDELPWDDNLEGD